MIVCLDANEHMKVGRLARVFRLLGLLETMEMFYQGPEQPIFHEERHQIDAVWVSPNLRPCASSMAPFYMGAGDHRIFVVDFSIDMVMGSRFILICKLSMRRLISCQPCLVQNYIGYAEFLFRHHRIKEKLEVLQEKWTDLSSCERENHLNKINLECTQLLLCSEHKCRKLRTGTVEFSPFLSKLGLR